ncbi:MAG: hypothetical protein DLM63_02845 [Solirubrobacterales bacterium]|nr:MAG: hypothetical protein DLM63_02845 [Solirubrobacterales bacterium]
MSALVPCHPSKPDVTAVVLTRDRPDDLARALESLDDTEVSLAILVIDNDSAPSAAERVAVTCAARPNVQLRRVERNLGCAGGRRLSSALANTKRVLFIDDDAALLPGALELLVADLDAHPEAGAVTATVIGPNGIVQHSGGSLEVSDGVACFDLIGPGVVPAPEALPPSGLAGWVPGTAVLVCRDLLEAFPIDEGMAAYYEDNEWCYRVSLDHPGIFRRSREALARHYLVGHEPGSGRFGRRAQVERLAACARFYARHGVLLGPWLFDELPELTAADGTRDLAGVRLLMEIILAKGVEWTEAAWLDGGLSGLISARRWRVELAQSHSELARLQGKLREREATLAQMQDELREQVATLAWLSSRHETLGRVEQGGWWRLHGRVLPAIRLLQWLRGWRTRTASGERTSRSTEFRRRGLVYVGGESEPVGAALPCWVTVSGERFRVQSLGAEPNCVLLDVPVSRVACTAAARESCVVVNVDGSPLTVDFAAGRASAHARSCLPLPSYAIKLAVPRARRDRRCFIATLGSRAPEAAVC